MPNQQNRYRKLYLKVWRKLGNTNPLLGDCGILCEKKCCQGSENDGMLLFPGEEALFPETDNSWYHISDSHISLSDGYKIKLLVCQGICPREERPLSCRIFPIIPYLNESGRVDFRPDLRCFGSCPIVYNSAENPVEEEFIENLYHAFPPLLKEDAVVEFIEILSQQADETAAFLQKFSEGQNT